MREPPSADPERDNAESMGRDRGEMSMSVTQAKAALDKAKRTHGHSSREAQEAKKALNEARNPRRPRL